MNESELESELRKLRPAAPSHALADGIARELAACVSIVAPLPGFRAGARPEPTQVPWLARWLDRLLWSGLGAATAMLALLLSYNPPKPGVAQVAQPSSRQVPREPVQMDASALQPVIASEDDLGWRDEGVRFDAHGQPMLKLSRTAVERHAWADLENAGVVQMEQPRQEVLWVPMPVH